MDKELYNRIYHELSLRVESHGVRCYGFEIVQEDDLDILRLYIENDLGVDLFTCESVSRDISQYLDTMEDTLPQHYLLEVTSPGLERPLFCQQNFIDNIGQTVKVEMVTEPSVVGRLTDANNLFINIDTGTENLEIQYKEIKSAHLVFTLAKGEKKTFKNNVVKIQRRNTM